MNGVSLWNRVRVVGALLGMGLCGAGAQAAETTATRPNILWISFEDFGLQLPFYGDNRAYMPNLTKLAESGCVFDRAFSTAPVCAPSRSTIITGVHAASLGTHNMRSEVKLPDDVKTFPTYLRKAGYYCTNNLKTDYNFTVPEGTWDASSGKAHWRNRPDPAQPFFSVFNFTVTHEGKYKMPARQYERIVKDVPKERRVDPATVTPPPYYPDTAVTRKDWARQYDIASQLDVEAGLILKQLEEDGLSTNTIIFLFSDHGVGLPRSKRWLYDSGLHVPLVVKWDGVTRPGSRNEELVSLMDLAPTVLSVVGVKIPAYMQGRVFVGPDKKPEPKYLFATRDRIDEVVDMSRSVRDRQYKYIRNFKPDLPRAQPSAYADGNPTLREMRRMHEDGTLTGPATLMFEPKPVEELYDTVADPHEITNLARLPEHKGRLEAMEKTLTEWQSAIGDKGFKPEPESEKRRAGARPSRARGAAGPADAATVDIKGSLPTDESQPQE